MKENFASPLFLGTAFIYEPYNGDSMTSLARSAQTEFFDIWKSFAKFVYLLAQYPLSVSVDYRNFFVTRPKGLVQVCFHRWYRLINPHASYY